MVKGKWENVIKPSSDRRSYRVVECNNELKAVLISDPQADKAAVAMTVQVGSSADPDELQVCYGLYRVDCHFVTL